MKQYCDIYLVYRYYSFPVTYRLIGKKMVMIFCSIAFRFTYLLHNVNHFLFLVLTPLILQGKYTHVGMLGLFEQQILNLVSNSI